VIKKSLYF